VIGAGEKTGRLPALHDLPFVHHRHAVADGGNGKKIVGDIKNAHTQFAIQRREQLQYLRLGDHIQCTRRLVRNQQLWLMQYRHGDEHPLRLSNAQLGRIAAQKAGICRQTHILQTIQQRLGGFFAGGPLVNRPGFLQLRADPQRRVQRRHRAL
jgi:hypothetical protein